jgi:L-threonylcarbamoyladenylate synthase
MFYQMSQLNEIVDSLLAGNLGVLPTDTIYGIHRLAHDQEAINRVYQVKGRPEKMPFIALLSSPKDLANFDITISDFAQTQINNLWPGPNTFIFEDSSGDTKSFRVPNNEFLQSILSKTGPLLSTSANPHGKPSALSAQEAFDYFGNSYASNNVDFYVDGGRLDNPPSNIYKFEGGQMLKIR